jgi:hypothetical protein
MLSRSALNSSADPYRDLLVNQKTSGKGRGAQSCLLPALRRAKVLVRVTSADPPVANPAQKVDSDSALRRTAHDAAYVPRGRCSAAVGHERTGSNSKQKEEPPNYSDQHQRSSKQSG